MLQSILKSPGKLTFDMKKSKIEIVFYLHEESSKGTSPSRISGAMRVVVNFPLDPSSR
jgi:hypothetical protein